VDLTEQFKQAVFQDNPAALRQLFAEHPELKSRINEPLFHFDTPAIVSASGRGSRDLIDALLELGADINARSTWWAGSFGVLDNDHYDLAPYLIERGAKLDAHAAARHGMFDKLRELIAANPDLVHARGGDGQTPLHVASSVEIARFLLDHGAAIDALDVDHESTPAQYLIRSHPEIVRFLIERGCKTDILMASAAGDVALVRRFLDADPESIRTRVNRQYFPMQNPHAGGSIYIWTLGGNRSPHQVAHSFGHPAVLELLFERTPDDLKLAQACLTGNAAMVKKMMAQDPAQVRALAQANPDFISNAAEDNDAAAVGLMLEAGWPLEGDCKHTPLHWAGWHGNTAMAQRILEFHPPLDALDTDYHATPLGWAIHGSENGWRRATGDYGGTVKALLAAGAKPPEKITGSQAVQEALRYRR
jgi:ankyrin repeat protein